MSGASVRDVRVAFLGLTSKLIAKRQSVSLKKYEKEIQQLNIAIAEAKKFVIDN